MRRGEGGWPSRRLDDVKFDLDGGELAGGGRREAGVWTGQPCRSSSREGGEARKIDQGKRRRKKLDWARRQPVGQVSASGKWHES